MRHTEFDAARALMPDPATPVADDPLEQTQVLIVPDRRYRMAEGRKMHVDALAAEVDSAIRKCPSEGLRAEWQRSRYGKA